MSTVTKHSNLLVLTGRRGSGKDTMTKDLVGNTYYLNQIGYNNAFRISFSDELRLLSNDLFDWCPVNPSYEDKDRIIDHPDNLLNLSPREVWKHVAGDGPTSLRHVDPKLVIKRFARRWEDYIIQNPRTLFIVTDWRTLQESEWVLAASDTRQRLRIVDGTGKAPLDEFERHVDTFDVFGEVTNMRVDESIDDFYEQLGKMYPVAR